MADLVSQILHGKLQLEEPRLNGGKSDATLRLSAALVAAAAASPAGDSSDTLRAVLQGIRRVSRVPSTLYLLVHFHGSFSVTLDGGHSR